MQNTVNLQIQTSIMMFLSAFKPVYLMTVMKCYGMCKQGNKDKGNGDWIRSWNNYMRHFLQIRLEGLSKGTKIGEEELNVLTTI